MERLVRRASVRRRRPLRPPPSLPPAPGTHGLRPQEIDVYATRVPAEGIELEVQRVREAKTIPVLDAAAPWC